MNPVPRLPRLAVLACLTLTFACTTATSAQDAKKAHPLKKAIELTEKSLQKMKKAESYEAELTKKEIVGKRAVTHRMKVKIRHEPFSVYLYYVDPQQRPRSSVR